MNDYVEVEVEVDGVNPGGTAILVRPVDPTPAVWVPLWAIHADSAVYPGSGPRGTLVVAVGLAQERGLVPRERRILPLKRDRQPPRPARPGGVLRVEGEDLYLDGRPCGVLDDQGSSMLGQLLGYLVRLERWADAVERPVGSRALDTRPRAR